MEGDIVVMGKLIGAGLACTGMGGAAIGVGIMTLGIVFLTPRKISQWR